MIPLVLKALLPIVIKTAVEQIARNNTVSVQTIEKAVIAAPEVRAALNKKPWWQSRAIIGGVGVVAASVGSLLGYAISAGELEEVLMHFDKIATAVFGLLAIWGRIAATRPLAR